MNTCTLCSVVFYQGLHSLRPFSFFHTGVRVRIRPVREVTDSEPDPTIKINQIRIRLIQFRFNLYCQYSMISIIEKVKILEILFLFYNLVLKDFGSGYSYWTRIQSSRITDPDSTKNTRIRLRKPASTLSERAAAVQRKKGKCIQLVINRRQGTRRPTLSTKDKQRVDPHYQPETSNA